MGPARDCHQGRKPGGRGSTCTERLSFCPSSILFGFRPGASLASTTWSGRSRLGTCSSSRSRAVSAAAVLLVPPPDCHLSFYLGSLVRSASQLQRRRCLEIALSGSRTAALGTQRLRAWTFNFARSGEGSCCPIWYSSASAVRGPGLVCQTVRPSRRVPRL